MEGSLFEEAAFFGAIAQSGVRAMLIGRRALIALGIPVLTADYARSPEEARGRGR